MPPPPSRLVITPRAVAAPRSPTRPHRRRRPGWSRSGRPAVAREERDRRRDLLGPAGSPHRHRLRVLVDQRLPAVLQASPPSGSALPRRTHLGSRTWTTRCAIVDAMFSRAARAAEECAISGTPRRGLNPTKHTKPRRFGIIHRSATRFVRCHGASTIESMDCAEALQPDLLEGCRELSSGVVDEDVGRPEPLVDRVEECLHLIGLRGRRRSSRARRGRRPPAQRAPPRGAPAAGRRSPRARRYAPARAPSPGRSRSHHRSRSRSGRCSHRRRAGTGTPLPCASEYEGATVRGAGNEEVDVPGGRGVRLAVRVHDGPSTSAPDLLLHHGLASSQRIWDLMMPRLTRRFRVVTYDARGHGSFRETRERVRLRPGRRRCTSGHPGCGPSATPSSSGIRGERWWRWSSRPAIPVRSVAPCSSTAVSARSARRWIGRPRNGKLAPPHLAGMPAEEFRRMIRTFLGDAVEVTPEIEEIVLSVVHVDGRSRIRPRLSRANHLPDPPCDLAPRPRCRTRASLGPHPRRPRSRRRRPRVGRTEAPSREAGGQTRRAGPHLVDGGDPRPAAAAPGRARRAGSNVSQDSSYDESMGWFILLLVVLAAAFGVLGAVLKLTAILVLTVLLTIAALIALVSYSFRSQIRPMGTRWHRGPVAGRRWVVGSTPRSHRGTCLPATIATSRGRDSSPARQGADQQAPEHQEQQGEGEPYRDEHQDPPSPRRSHDHGSDQQPDGHSDDPA